MKKINGYRKQIFGLIICCGLLVSSSGVAAAALGPDGLEYINQPGIQQLQSGVDCSRVTPGQRCWY